MVCSIKKILEYLKDFQLCQTKTELRHPTQNHKLYQWVLNKYAKQGDKILDTHLGSGIAIACHDYKFDLTACELDKEYFDVERIKTILTKHNCFNE
jgi:site-specific DNA-methyltransferase (adenine-specific)